MDFQLFSDIDENFSISLIDNGDIVKTIHLHPETNLPMDRPTAISVAEDICNKKVIETKLDFFNSMSESDYENFAVAKGSITTEIVQKGIMNVSEETKTFHVLLLKMDMLPDFAFKEKEIETLTNFCKVFDISVIPNISEE